MINVRPAVAADADELMRLRGIMLSAMTGGAVPAGPWQESGAAVLRRTSRSSS